MVVRRGICFDLDGTLINSSPKGWIQFWKVAQLLNLETSPEIETRVKAIWGKNFSNLVKTAWPETDIKMFCREWENLDLNETYPLFPGTKESLTQLSDHFMLSILTNRNTRTAVPQLVRSNLNKFFRILIAADSSSYRKPHPRSIQPIFNRYRAFGISSDNIIFVGDTVEADWRLAQAISIEFFAVLSGGMDNRDKFLTAGVPEDHIIDSVADLPRILLT
jgi:HAD superfamily hydrolase (TIGR01549 family)